MQLIAHMCYCHTARTNSNYFRWYCINFLITQNSSIVNYRVNYFLFSHELAIQLQEEENRRAAAAAAPAAQHQRQPAHRTQSAPVGGVATQKKKDKDVSVNIVNIYRPRT